MLCVLVGACHREAATEPTPFEESLAELRSPDPGTRAMGIRMMVYYCCSGEARVPIQQAIACGSLSPAIDGESDPEILDSIHAMSIFPQSERCIRAVPDTIVIGALERVDAEVTKQKIVDALVNYDPSQAIARALIAEMGPSRRSEHGLYLSIARTLASYGEPELALVVAALRDRDVDTRRVAAETLRQASEAPLALRGLDGALERATHDDDDEVAMAARIALHERQQHRGERLDDAVARLSREPDNLYWFGRRVAFCGSQVAAAELDRAAAKRQPHWAGIARRLIEVRRARCGEDAP